jgi:RimJ/RimL family protein N-acetyltransferase
MPWAHFPQTVDGQRKRIVDNYHKYWAGQDFGFGIFAPDNKKFLGGCGLHPRSLNQQCLEIGYWVRSSVAGQGLCTEVTKALTVYCFSYMGLSRVQCGFDVKNLASQRVNQKCGFKTEGFLREFCPLPNALKANAVGWDGSGDITITSLLRQDLPNLSWYNDTLGRLKVYDWGDNEATPKQPI